MIHCKSLCVLLQKWLLICEMSSVSSSVENNHIASYFISFNTYQRISVSKLLNQQTVETRNQEIVNHISQSSVVCVDPALGLNFNLNWFLQGIAI